MSAISLTDMSLLDYSSSSIVIQAMEIIESVIDPVSGHTVLTISTVCVCVARFTLTENKQYIRLGNTHSLVKYQISYLK